MSIAAILPVLTTAASVGLGCGTCCSPVISTFLSSYVLAHAGSAGRGLVSFVSFFCGKLASVTVLCIAASVVGTQLIGENGCIGDFNLRLAAQIAMSAIGVVLTVRWIRGRRRAEHECGGCSCKGGTATSAGILPMLCAGFAYGCTPCAPLILILGYAFTLPAHMAALTGAAFSAASMISPALVLAAVTGALSRKMRQEIPQCLKWFQVGSYVLLAVVPFVV